MQGKRTDGRYHGLGLGCFIEGGLIAVGGAVGNAIAAALTDFGVEPRDLPLSPAKLWNLIDRARAENPSGGA